MESVQQEKQFYPFQKLKYAENILTHLSIFNINIFTINFQHYLSFTYFPC